MGGIWIENNVVVDKDMNLYVGIEFYYPLHVNDTLFVNQSTSTDIVLLKFNSEFELLWGRYIYSQAQDSFNDLLLTSDDNLFLSTQHGSGDQDSTDISFLGQKTIRCGKSIQSFMKIDLKGTILWQRLLTSYSNRTDDFISATEVNGNYYISGQLDKEIYLDEDTIMNTSDGYYSSYPYNIVLKPDGSLLQGNVLDYTPLRMYPRIPDNNGNYFFSAKLYDTTVFGYDTLIFNFDTCAEIIGKTDSLNNPIWYKIIKNPYHSYYYYFWIDVKEDTLYFVTACPEETFSFCDSTYHVAGSSQNLLQGKFTADGNLIDPVVSLYSDFITPTHLKIDNCGNSIISGGFKGDLVVGSDTLFQTNSSIADGFLAKYCNHKQPLLNLGNDTTISLSESITLEVDNYFSNIIWSTGDTTHSITINGSDYGEGVYQFGVEAFKGTCPVKDSISITIFDDSSIPENRNNSVVFYPNPANSTINFYKNKNIDIEEVTIYNLSGKKLIHQKQVKGFIDISGLRTGVYILETTTENSKISKKLVVKK